MKKTTYFSNFELINKLADGNEKISKRYFVFHINKNFHLYARITKGGKCYGIHIDSELLQLKEILSNIEGITFSHEGIVAIKELQLITQQQNVLDSDAQFTAWEAKFQSDIACEMFFEICRIYSLKGIESAQDWAMRFPQKHQKITSKKSVGTIRIGQNDFRKNLLKHWKSCAVTGFKNTSILKASHIKPWSKSNAKEKLDPFNGLLLIPNLDCLFDSGVISFDQQGKIVLSSALQLTEYETLGVTSDMRIRKLNDAHLPYLKYHIENIFNAH